MPQCRDDSHDNERGEESFRNDPALQPNVDDNEFHQAASIHKRTFGISVITDGDKHLTARKAARVAPMAAESCTVNFV